MCSTQVVFPNGAYNVFLTNSIYMHTCKDQHFIVRFIIGGGGKQSMLAKRLKIVDHPLMLSNSAVTMF